MKHFTAQKKYYVAPIAATFAPMSFADTTALDTILAAVDLSTVTTFIASTGGIIVGIALAVKGISLAKRLVTRA